MKGKLALAWIILHAGNLFLASLSCYSLMASLSGCQRTFDNFVLISLHHFAVVLCTHVDTVNIEQFLFQFDTEAEAQKAIQAENGMEFNGRKMDVKVAKRRPQDEKKEGVDQQQQQQPPMQRMSQPEPEGHRQQQFQDSYGGNDQQWNSGGRGGGRGGRGGFRGRGAPYNNRRDQGDFGGGGDGYQVR